LGDIVSSKPVAESSASVPCARPKQCNDAVGILPLQILVNVQQRVRHQFHPQFFDLMHDLELQLIRIAQSVVIQLAGKQSLGIQI
jgi:hypothetical protein